MKKKFLILLIAISFPVMLFAQVDSWTQNLLKDWKAGIMGGVSYLSTEIKKDFSYTSMDMNSKPNGAFYLHLDKSFQSNFGIGFDYEKNFFSGDKTYPNNINWLMYHSRFNNKTGHFVPDPIYYKTNITSTFINVIYDFPNFKTTKEKVLNLNSFLKLGWGLTSVGVEMGYQDITSYRKANLPNPLYEKGRGIQAIRDLYGTFHMGGGINYYITPRFSLSAELMFLFVSNDYLDGVQNYEVTVMPGNEVVINRMEVYAMAAEFKAGISYHFHWVRKTKNSSDWQLNFADFKNKFYYEQKARSPK